MIGLGIPAEDKGLHRVGLRPGEELLALLGSARSRGLGSGIQPEGFAAWAEELGRHEAPVLRLDIEDDLAVGVAEELALVVELLELLVEPRLGAAAGEEALLDELGDRATALDTKSKSTRRGSDGQAIVCCRSSREG